MNQMVKDGDKEAKKFIVIDNKLYDVTDFVEDHPGGQDVLLTHVGKDASGNTKFYLNTKKKAVKITFFN